jgi:drug/metabolite transporter (DMT)-like permease
MERKEQEQLISRFGDLYRRSSGKRKLIGICAAAVVIAAIFAGIAASLTYLLVLMAMNYVSNVTYVQIFRQSGLLFGVALGILVLKEKPLPPRITGAVLIVTGLILCSIR